ncbi:uncharacterized protein VTP21DRAFT_6429 [Calcarisporiella thermophila]|uniref:uncharacterized protein n=1 Tax=Calcarisporiella thermophila TaxID=911321 RepID=UPI003744411B
MIRVKEGTGEFSEHRGRRRPSWGVEISGPWLSIWAGRRGEKAKVGGKSEEVGGGVSEQTLGQFFTQLCMIKRITKGDIFVRIARPLVQLKTVTRQDLFPFPVPSPSVPGLICPKIEYAKSCRSDSLEEKWENNALAHLPALHAPTRVFNGISYSTTPATAWDHSTAELEVAS